MHASGESPWICQRDIQLVLSFAVGSKKCTVRLTLAKGNIVQEVCQRLFNEENVPVYMQTNLMDAVLRTVTEASLSAVVHSEDILDVGLMIEQARLLSRQFDVTTTVTQELANSFVSSFGAVDITWSLKPNPNFAAELGRNSFSSPPRTSFSGSSYQSPTPIRADSSSNEVLDAQKLISSSVARGARTPQQSLDLAKMYHFLVAGDQSVTPKSSASDTLGKVDSNSRNEAAESLIDGRIPENYGGRASQLGEALLEPTVVKIAALEATQGVERKQVERKIERQWYRSKRQAGGADLLLLQDTTNEFRDMIAELEKSMAQSMVQLTQARETALAAMGEKHAREMDKVSQSGQTERIPQLVDRHLLEMEGLEAKWEVELAEARKRQRREYYAFCSDLYKNRDRYLEDKRAMGPQKVSALVKQQQLADASQNSASNASKRLLSGSWTSLIFGKAANANTGGSGAGKVIRIASHNSSLMMAREMTHDHGTYSIVVMLGSQLKVPFEVQVYGRGGMLSQGNIGNVAHLTPTSSSLASPVVHAESSSSTDSIYSSNLTAMILITDPSMACNSPTYQDFFALTALSTELHFESAQDQIEAVRSQVLSTPNNAAEELKSANPSSLFGSPSSPSPLSSSTSSMQAQKLQPGDFFVTTHSNLGKVQVVFHMVGERQNVANSWPQLLAGLKNILTVASHYDITTLSLPVLLVEPEFRHLYSDGQGIKRTEEVVRAIRSFLVLNSASGTSLKAIRLVCPPSQTTSHSQQSPSSPPTDDIQYFDKVKSVVSTLFNQPLH